VQPSVLKNGELRDYQLGTHIHALQYTGREALEDQAAGPVPIRLRTCVCVILDPKHEVPVSA
jgi:hypothetical protein